MGERGREHDRMEDSVTSGGRWWRSHLLLAVGIAVMAAVVTLVATRSGPVVRVDSTYYLSGAESVAGHSPLDFLSGVKSVATGHRPQDYNDVFITTFPPGYSTALGAVVAAGLSSSDAARAVNAASAALIVLLTFLLARRHLDSRWGPILVTAFVAFSAGWTHVTVEALSEALFGVFVLAFLLLLDRAVPRAATGELRARHVAALGLTAGVACAIRYLGLALLAVGVITVVLGVWRGSRSKAVARCGVFLGAAVPIPLVLAVHNVRVGSGPFGARAGETTATLPGTAHELVDVLRSWVSPELGGGAADLASWLIVIGLAVVVVVALARTRGRPPHSKHAASIAPVAILVAVMAAWLVASVLATPLDPINLRLAAPFFAPAIVLVGWSIEGLAFVPTARPAVRLAAATLVVSWVALTAASALSFSLQSDDHGPSVLLAGDPTSALTTSVEALPHDAVIYSNSPWRMWAASHRGGWLSPRQVVFKTTLATDDLPAMVADVSSAEACGKPVYLVWYADTRHTTLMQPLDVLRGELELAPAGPGSGSGSDADSLYQVSTKGSPARACKPHS
jgi:hypothetical protein